MSPAAVVGAAVSRAWEGHDVAIVCEAPELIEILTERSKHIPDVRSHVRVVSITSGGTLGDHTGPVIFTDRARAALELLTEARRLADAFEGSLTPSGHLRQVLDLIADPTASDHDVDAAAVHLDDEDAARIGALLRSVSRHRRNGR